MIAERLTEHGDHPCVHCEGIGSCRIDCDNKKIYEKLQYYEDLEEAGRLIELPCAVGDTVWEIRWWDEVTESKVIDGKKYFRSVRKHKVTKTQFSLFDYKDFGKIVFLTKEEAEAALKERESE